MKMDLNAFTDLVLTIVKFRKLLAEKMLQDELMEQLYRDCEAARLKRLSETEKGNMVQQDLLSDLKRIRAVSPIYQNAFTDYLKSWYKGLRCLTSRPLKRFCRPR